MESIFKFSYIGAANWYTIVIGFWVNHCLNALTSVEDNLLFNTPIYHLSVEAVSKWPWAKPSLVTVLKYSSSPIQLSLSETASLVCQEPQIWVLFWFPEAYS